jgi:hypothetical protein
MSNMPEELFASKMEELERLMYTQMWNCCNANMRNYLISKYGQQEMDRRFADMSTTFFDCADKYDLLSQVTLFKQYVMCNVYRTDVYQKTRRIKMLVWRKEKMTVTHNWDQDLGDEKFIVYFQKSVPIN